MIIKQINAHNENFPWSFERVRTSTAGVVSGEKRSGQASFRFGLNRIEYQSGPRVIKMGGTHVPNWKECWHDRYDSIEGYDVEASSTIIASNGAINECHVYNWPVFGLINRLGATTWPEPPDTENLSRECREMLYADIAGRANSYVLTLEDLAGFVSGNSLLKSITGVATATDKLYRALRTCRRLKRKFGNVSLKKCWEKSADFVRAVVGLRLGYRFSFSTTLRDVSDAIGWSSEYATHLQKIVKRNASEYLSFSKSQTMTSRETVDREPDEVGPYVFGELTGFFSPKSLDNREWLLRAKGINEYGVTVKTFARAKVRYPTDYQTFGRYFSGRAGLDKPLTTIWAIVPLSFVVDYLVNVQRSLTALDNRLNDALLDIQFGGSWTCRNVFRRRRVEIPGFQGACRLGYLANPRSCYASIPGMNISNYLESSFTRLAGAGLSISDQLSPLIVGQQNWTTKVGTGLELLISKRRH